jgi:hypothetical protein
MSEFLLRPPHWESVFLKVIAPPLSLRIDQAQELEALLVTLSGNA